MKKKFRHASAAPNVKLISNCVIKKKNKSGRDLQEKYFIVKTNELPSHRWPSPFFLVAWRVFHVFFPSLMVILGNSLFQWWSPSLNFSSLYMLAVLTPFSLFIVFNIKKREMNKKKKRTHLMISKSIITFLGSTIKKKVISGSRIYV